MAAHFGGNRVDRHRGGHRIFYDDGSTYGEYCGDRAHRINCCGGRLVIHRLGGHHSADYWHLVGVGKGWNLTEPWIFTAIGLYVFVGVFWLPVIWIQHQLRDLANEALKNETPLPDMYHRLFRAWVFCGFPGFFAILGILWLMVAQPGFGV